MLAACAGLNLAGPAGLVARSTLTTHAAVARAAEPTTVTASPAACADGKYNLLGPKWTSTYRWSFKSATTPSYLNTADALAAIKRGVTNITQARNDCGRADLISASQSYLGTTTRGIGVTRYARCGTSDGFNTIGFGTLPSGVLAVTCVRSIGSRIIEADIRFNTRVSWALSLAGCSNDYMLEAVGTHEAGHVYGMEHVGETNHGLLTMSTYLNGTCENSESTLGLGDLKGLEALY
jgi:hypothetical protein